MFGKGNSIRQRQNNDIYNLPTMRWSLLRSLEKNLKKSKIKNRNQIQHQIITQSLGLRLKNQKNSVVTLSSTNLLSSRTRERLRALHLTRPMKLLIINRMSWQRSNLCVGIASLNRYVCRSRGMIWLKWLIVFLRMPIHMDHTELWHLTVSSICWAVGVSPSRYLVVARQD
jgi:hypothetical protein